MGFLWPDTVNLNDALFYQAHAWGDRAVQVAFVNLSLTRSMTAGASCNSIHPRRNKDAMSSAFLSSCKVTSTPSLSISL